MPNFMRHAFKHTPTEARRSLKVCAGPSFGTNTFFTLGNITSLINNNAVNLIWAVGLLVVLIAGGIDISFAVAASVVQYSAQVYDIESNCLSGYWLQAVVVSTWLN